MSAAILLDIARHLERDGDEHGMAPRLRALAATTAANAPVPPMRALAAEPVFAPNIGADLVHAIDAELHAARRQFPTSDCIMTALTEEVGELARALLEESLERVRAEAVQVATMAIRVATEGDPTLHAYRRGRGLDVRESDIPDALYPAGAAPMPQPPATAAQDWHEHEFADGACTVCGRTAHAAAQAME